MKHRCKVPVGNFPSTYVYLHILMCGKFISNADKQVGCSIVMFLKPAYTIIHLFPTLLENFLHTHHELLLHALTSCFKYEATPSVKASYFKLENVFVGIEM